MRFLCTGPPQLDSVAIVKRRREDLEEKQQKELQAKGVLAAAIFLIKTNSVVEVSEAIALA
ncbi:unnamed protein product [Amoebophrya sp. A120]|nr:unnamed protein product [Amoebophrya sp. A120]|eukprot:GSA120T00015383001.1